MQPLNFENVFLRKSLVLDVCEPYMEKVTVTHPGFSFELYKFGTFELGNSRYAFGTEEHEYEYAVSSAPYESKLPIVFARVIEDDDGNTSYEFVPTSFFLEDSAFSVDKTIEYSLECQQVAGHYMLGCRA